MTLLEKLAVAPAGGLRRLAGMIECLGARDRLAAFPGRFFGGDPNEFLLEGRHRRRARGEAERHQVEPEPVLSRHTQPASVLGKLAVCIKPLVKAVELKPELDDPVDEQALCDARVPANVRNQLGLEVPDEPAERRAADDLAHGATMQPTRSLGAGIANRKRWRGGVRGRSAHA